MSAVSARSPDHLRLVLGGDLMLGRGVDAIRPIHNPAEFGDVLNDYEGRPDLINRRGDLGALVVVDVDASTLQLARWQRLVFRREGFCLRRADPDEVAIVDARLSGRSPQ